MRIPNPTKKITVDFSIDRIRTSVKMLPYYHKKYKIEKYNDPFNQYTFGSSEFLSAGVFVDIHLNSVTETKTEVFIEVRRKLGSFNQSQEITYANRHIDRIIDSLGKLTVMPESELRSMYEGKASKSVRSTVDKPKKKFYQTWWFWVAVFLAFAAIVGGSDDEQSGSDTVTENTGTVKSTSGKPKPRKTKSAEEQLHSQMSAWDGSLPPLVEVVKENMNDPKSFEHDKTVYRQTAADSLEFIMTMTFRGKNAFGGVVKNVASARYNARTKTLSDVEIY